jgi:hypothetical protein
MGGFMNPVDECWFLKKLVNKWMALVFSWNMTWWFVRIVIPLGEVMAK